MATPRLRGVTAHDNWDGDIATNKTSPMLCARLLRTARARDWIEVDQARMRRKVQHNAIVQTCQIGTRFTYIGVDFTRNSVACSTSARATSSSSLRGARGAIGPTIAMTGVSRFSRQPIVPQTARRGSKMMIEDR